MINQILNKQLSKPQTSLLISNPYKFFFPLGILLLVWGALVWVPLIWTGGIYPVLAHRYLMLNGFTACFIAGFLMTAVPRFSQTDHAHIWEIAVFFILTCFGLGHAYANNPAMVYFLSALQAIHILVFMFRRIFKRKQNPPYSFIFIFVGLALWALSGIYGFAVDEQLKALHYEGAIAAIILGVGCRLVPGIMGHVEIVKSQRDLYEQPIPLFKTIPLSFTLVGLAFILSYFFPSLGPSVRAVAVTYLCLRYWKLYTLPKERTSLTVSLWISGWMIVLSFVFSALLPSAGIHISHSFFINGIVLLCLLIATRVIQSHGPKDKSLENLKIIYLITGLLLAAAATRISAFYIPRLYMTHLGYSSVVLILAVGIWAQRYLTFIFKKQPT